MGRGGKKGVMKGGAIVGGIVRRVVGGMIIVGGWVEGCVERAA